ncbi:MarR family winged helix-turn-helix transcriptional regulator [Enterococcus italicus]|uniref:MarR family winged helix-turn-helix transcriptional regulator n=1 Tax=Enterococcus italicus TaxID=246144 RepID=UPI003F47C9A1
MNFGKLIKIASIQLAREMDTFAQQYQLTGTQMSVLNYLAKHQERPVDQNELATEFGVKKSTMSVIIKRMEERAIITRQAEGRNKYLSITPSGQTYVTAIQTFIQKDNQRLIAAFDSSEQAVIERFLKGVANDYDTNHHNRI